MRKYDPERGPDPLRWLDLDESTRIDLVVAYHEATGFDPAHIAMHAVLHTVVENQIALRHPPTLRAMARLAEGGLLRHESLHAISWVLSQHAVAAVADPTAAADVGAQYDDAVERLTVAQWSAFRDEAGASD